MGEFVRRQAPWSQWLLVVEHVLESFGVEKTKAPAIEGVKVSAVESIHDPLRQLAESTPGQI